MTDETTRLAARIARLEGHTHPLAWVKVYEDHTPYEWAVQLALAAIEPWGEDRADLRAAVNTAQLVASNRTEPMEDGKFTAMVRSLARYLKCHEDPHQVVGPKAMRQALGDS